VKAFALAALVALLCVGTAVAGPRTDPQKRFTRADQARAKAMLIRKSDLGTDVQTIPASGSDAGIACPALDGSGLTLTGQAQSPTFQGGVEFVSSQSEIYESVADSTTAWRRATSKAADSCVQREFSALFAKQGAQLESFRRIAFPKVAERSIAYRLQITSAGIRAFVDVVGLKLGRAQSALLLGSALAPLPRATELSLVRTVSSRMTKAMRGAQKN